MITVTLRDERAPEIVEVALAGELDISSAPEVERAIFGAERGNPALLLLDLRELQFIDSTGLRLVLAADHRARRDGRRFVVVPGRHSVHRVFQISLLDRRLEFLDDPTTLAGHGAGGAR